MYFDVASDSGFHLFILRKLIDFSIPEKIPENNSSYAI